MSHSDDVKRAEIADCHVKQSHMTPYLESPTDLSLVIVPRELQSPDPSENSCLSTSQCNQGSGTWAQQPSKSCYPAHVPIESLPAFQSHENARIAYDVSDSGTDCMPQLQAALLEHTAGTSDVDSDAALADVEFQDINLDPVAFQEYLTATFQQLMTQYVSVDNDALFPPAPGQHKPASRSSDGETQSVDCKTRSVELMTLAVKEGSLAFQIAQLVDMHGHSLATACAETATLNHEVFTVTGTEGNDRMAVLADVSFSDDSFSISGLGLRSPFLRTQQAYNDPGDDGHFSDINVELDELDIDFALPRDRFMSPSRTFSSDVSGHLTGCWPVSYRDPSQTCFQRTECRSAGAVGVSSVLGVDQTIFLPRKRTDNSSIPVQ